jgi:methylated-DNA-[protein]-cysteine S-methyltransferase
MLARNAMMGELRQRFMYAQKTAIGLISIMEESGNITHVCFEADRLPDVAKTKNTELLQEAFEQLDAYFAGRLKTFDLPIAPGGTPFQQKVWQAVLTCPFGVTASYKDIAYRIGQPKAVRAVGAANGKNPIPILIPCHRIIGSSGSMTGYRGGIELKARLLALEQDVLNGEK